MSCRRKTRASFFTEQHAKGLFGKNATYRTLSRERRSAMWNLSSYVGVATATVDFTREFSWFITGLIGLVWLSAGALVLMALGDREAKSLSRAVEGEEAAYQEAA
jgi:hypothetical protein